MIKFVSEYKYFWSGLPTKQKINLILAGVSKLVCFVATIFLGFYLGERLLIDRDRYLIWIILISYYINSWTVTELKNWYK